jgi:hypothetical protein
MAVIQISKIQVRRGLEENLPQLAAGEFGWATDTRKLYIGNGVTGSPDYAPSIGNTEVLTIYSYDALSLRLDDLEANVANLQSNVTSIQSQLGINTLTFTNNTTANTSLTLSSLSTSIIDYKLIRATASRVGTISVTQYNGTPVFQDDYAESGTTGITLAFSANVSNVANISLDYTSANIGNNATFSYYIRSFV